MVLEIADRLIGNRLGCLFLLLRMSSSGRFIFNTHAILFRAFTMDGQTYFSSYRYDNSVTLRFSVGPLWNDLLRTIAKGPQQRNENSNKRNSPS